MRHNYVYYVHLLCFEPLFWQSGKDFFRLRSRPSIWSCLKKRRRVYCLRRKDIAADLNRLRNASPCFLLRLSTDEFWRDPESEVISLIFFCGVTI